MVVVSGLSVSGVSSDFALVLIFSCVFSTTPFVPLSLVSFFVCSCSSLHSCLFRLCCRSHVICARVSSCAAVGISSHPLLLLILVSNPACLRAYVCMSLSLSLSRHLSVHQMCLFVVFSRIARFLLVVHLVDSFPPPKQRTRCSFPFHFLHHRLPLLSKGCLSTLFYSRTLIPPSLVSRCRILFGDAPHRSRANLSRFFFEWGVVYNPTPLAHTPSRLFPSTCSVVVAMTASCALRRTGLATVHG